MLVFIILFAFLVLGFLLGAITFRHFARTGKGKMKLCQTCECYIQSQKFDGFKKRVEDANGGNIPA